MTFADNWFRAVTAQATNKKAEIVSAKCGVQNFLRYNACRKCSHQSVFFSLGMHLHRDHLWRGHSVRRKLSNTNNFPSSCLLLLPCLQLALFLPLLRHPLWMRQPEFHSCLGSDALGGFCPTAQGRACALAGVAQSSLGPPMLILGHRSRAAHCYVQEGLGQATARRTTTRTAEGSCQASKCFERQSRGSILQAQRTLEECRAKVDDARLAVLQATEELEAFRMERRESTEAAVGCETQRNLVANMLAEKISAMVAQARNSKEELSNTQRQRDLCGTSDTHSPNASRHWAQTCRRRANWQRGC